MFIIQKNPWDNFPGGFTDYLCKLSVIDAHFLTFMEKEMLNYCSTVLIFNIIFS